MIRKAFRNMPYYSVARGRTPGIYNDWDSCKQQVAGFPNSRYKKFNSHEEAKKFIEVHSGSATPVQNTSSTSRASLKRTCSSQLSQPTKKRLYSTIQDGTVTSSESNKPVELRVYVDGGSRGNGRASAIAGYGVFFGKDDSRNAGKPLLEGLPTNQRAELSAVKHALTVINKEIEETGSLKGRYVIYTDSQYTINCLTIWTASWIRKKWVSSAGTPVKNKDIISDCISILKAVNTYYASRGWGDLTFVHVKGHSGDFGNDNADKLANIGMDIASDSVKRKKKIE